MKRSAALLVFLFGLLFFIPAAASAQDATPEAAATPESPVISAVINDEDDSALIKVYAQDGAGVFAGPSALADEIARTYDAVVIGEVESIRERYHLLTAQRKIAAPLVGRLITRGHAMFPARRSRFREP